MVKYLINFRVPSMQILHFLQLILQIRAIRVLFVKESATGLAAGPTTKYDGIGFVNLTVECIGNAIAEHEAKYPNLHAVPQQPYESSYLTNLPHRLSKFVSLKAIDAFTRCTGEIYKISPITIPLRCDKDWKYAEAVLKIVDGTAKELPPEMIETEAGRTQLINIYQTLQIQDLSYTRHFVDALCMDKRTPIGISDHITYLKMWLRVFCAACDHCAACDFFCPRHSYSASCHCVTCSSCGARGFVSDNLWLDLFQALRRRDPMWHLTMKDISFVLQSLGLPYVRIYKTASPFIRIIIQLLSNGGYGLVTEYECFLEGMPLAGRFEEIVDIVRCASGENGMLFASRSIHPFLLNEEALNRKKRWLSFASVSIRIMKNKRVFVNVRGNRSSLLALELIKDVFAELLPGQVTDLLLNISTEYEEFWNMLVTGTTDVISTLAAQPLANIWIFSSNCMPRFLKSTKDHLCNLKQLKTMRNAQLMVEVHRLLVRCKEEDVVFSTFESCRSCSSKAKPCLIHWWAHIEEHTCKPSFILPQMDSRILSGASFMLASLLSTSDKVSSDSNNGG